jgi:ABC-type bacteriocin/lantibiotic exporter with double-glycine peptidase domain
MPANLSSVPLLEQEFRYSCVPASARMALAHLGRAHDEVELRSILRTTTEGTDFDNLAELATLDLEVHFYKGTASLLDYWLQAGYPAIVGLDTMFLGYWTIRCPHAAVVVGIDDDSVTLNDPMFPDEPKVVPMIEFLLAWGMPEYQTAVILPPSES